MQVQVTDVNVRWLVVVAALRTILQAVMAEYRDLLLILTLVSLLDTLGRRLDGQRRTVEAKYAVLCRRRLHVIRDGAFKEGQRQHFGRSTTLLRADLEHVFNGHQRIITNAWQVFLQVLLGILAENYLALLRETIAFTPLVSLRRTEHLEYLVDLVQFARAWK